MQPISPKEKGHPIVAVLRDFDIARSEKVNSLIQSGQDTTALVADTTRKVVRVTNSLSASPFISRNEHAFLGDLACKWFNYVAYLGLRGIPAPHTSSYLGYER